MSGVLFFLISIFCRIFLLDSFCEKEAHIPATSNSQIDEIWQRNFTRQAFKDSGEPRETGFFNVGKTRYVYHWCALPPSSPGGSRNRRLFPRQRLNSRHAGVFPELAIKQSGKEKVEYPMQRFTCLLGNMTLQQP